MHTALTVCALLVPGHKRSNHCLQVALIAHPCGWLHSLLVINLLWWSNVAGHRP
jgi:hypothetical protein